jgi:ribosome biogenesis GTPase
MISARVLWGANNIFMVLTSSGQVLESRIRGKILDLNDDPHNPLAPGDRVEIDDKARIIQRLPRKNAFHRWNKKHQALQTIAANIDQMVILGALGTPPFRPRFLDRAILTCLYDEIPFILAINKFELGPSKDIIERLEVYQSLGYQVVPISVHSAEGLIELEPLLEGKITGCVGQSGVGKSSLLKRLYPLTNPKIGEISEKHQRGRHTTTLAKMYIKDSDLEGFIDTPGVRELDVSFFEPEQISFYFPDFEPYRQECALSSCTHDHEPGCKVIDAFEEGHIHHDRYESYLRILQEVKFYRKGRY